MLPRLDYAEGKSPHVIKKGAKKGVPAPPPSPVPGAPPAPAPAFNHAQALTELMAAQTKGEAVGGPDPRGDLAHLPAVERLAPARQAIAEAIAANARKTGVGLAVHDLYAAVPHLGLTPPEFRATLLHMHHGGGNRLGGWPRMLDDLPRPDLAPVVSGKVMGVVHPAASLDYAAGGVPAPPPGQPAPPAPLFHVTRKGLGDTIRKEGFKAGTKESLELGPGVYLSRGRESFPTHLRSHATGKSYETETLPVALHPSVKLFPFPEEVANPITAIYRGLYGADYGKRYDADSAAGKLYTARGLPNWPHVHEQLKAHGYGGIERPSSEGDAGNTDMVVFDPKHVTVHDPSPAAAHYAAGGGGAVPADLLPVSESYARPDAPLVYGDDTIDAMLAPTNGHAPVPAAYAAEVKPPARPLILEEPAAPEPDHGTAKAIDRLASLLGKWAPRLLPADRRDGRKRRFVYDDGTGCTVTEKVGEDGTRTFAVKYDDGTQATVTEGDDGQRTLHFKYPDGEETTMTEG